MAHPKRKTSKQRRDKRRTHLVEEPKQLSSCSNCGTTTQYHRICPECGHYRGQLVINKERAV